MKTTPRLTPIAALTASAGFAALLALPAHAQEAKNTDVVNLERIVVTGSNLRRQDFETAAPLQVFRRAEIEQSGHTTLSDLLRAGISANNSGTLSFKWRRHTLKTWPPGWSAHSTRMPLALNRAVSFLPGSNMPASD